MKKILTITMILLFSNFLNAQSNYDNDWKTVQIHENNGLPKSALAVVETIYNQAKVNNNSVQIIKCVLYKSKYALTLEENAQLNIVNSIKDEITKANTPEKNMLESILANLYWQYFNQNRYKFYDRTNTAEKVDVSDFRTWDLHTIFEEIHEHHQNALQNALQLQQVDLNKFNEILNSQSGSKIYRPTVYDFIANKALDFYKTGESNLAQPAYKFEIDNPDFLGDNNTFAKTNFTAKDTLSQKLEALNIYKNLTLFHENDSEKTALVDLTLNRLDFVRQNAKFLKKEIVYFNTLLKLQQQFRNNEISTEVDYRIAQYYQQEASQYYTNKNKNLQFKMKDALAVCNEAIAKFPKSNGAQKCLNLKNQILLATVNLQNEIAVEPNKESRLLVNYKNTNQLFFQIYKTTSHFAWELNKTHNQNEKLAKIKALEVVTNFNSPLKNIGDYQSHSTEIILPKLKQGEYLILASTNGNFDDSNVFSYSFIQATNIALIEINSYNEFKYQVVNRKTGKPLSGAKVHFKNRNVSRYNPEIDKTKISDNDGFVSLFVKKHYNQVSISVSHNDDFAIFDNYRLYKQNHRNRNHEFENKTVFLFSDRSIYRPSQTVYFKGIIVSQRENKSEVIANKKVKLTLRDVNYQEVKTMDLVSNEFGSFSGEFILPNGGLTGNYTIEVQGNDGLINGKNRINGNLNIQVEEYKRPKFSAKFNKITNAFKLNDQIKIKGTATAYAGSLISDAKVVYRVKRNVRYPKWYYWYRPYGSTSEAQEITHGETKTNDKGEFEIDFLAQPDTSVNKKDSPIFSYEIIADITDINGETRSATTVVKVGYHSQTIVVSIDEKLDKYSKNNKITIDTKNLNGEFVATKGTLKIYKIKAPNKVFRNRPWGMPDYQEIDQATFERLFPHDVYKKESAENEKGKLVFETKFDTGKSKEIQFKKIKKWQSGAYIIVAEATDKFQQKITDKTRFSLFSNDDKQVPDNQLFDISLDKENYKKGEIVKLKIGSASNDLTVVINIEKDNKIIDTEIVHLSNEIKIIKIPVNEKDLGGFGINYHLVNYNSFLSGNLAVQVPHPKMDLDIETLTFRDKLQPGAEETWNFKITGCEKEAATAEILTSMYDASLDQFRKHKWQFNPIYQRNYYASTRANAGKSFGVNSFRTYQNRQKFINIKYQGYDDLNWFGLHFGYNRGGYGSLQPMIMEEHMNSDAVMIKSTPRGNRKMKMASSMEAPSPAPMADNGITALNFSGELEQDKLSGGNGINNNADDTDFSSIKLRTNFKETAFFFPQLKTDKKGNVSFSFTTPESLTQWKIQLLAHTKDLHSVIKTMETVTQKELMVLPNPPRFLREGDEIVISSKIANLTNKSLSGNAELQLFDAITNKSIDTNLGNDAKTKSFTVNAKGNSNVSWTLHIPENIQSVQYKIVAKAGNFSDGEQNFLPVLSNRMLVTETLPMWIRSNETKTFKLDKLADNTSSTIKNHKLTLEVTSNPAWYAVQALPYLMEYPYECAEQTFSRYYANTLASHIANSNPRIQEVFNQWKNSDALLSNLEKNQELKSLIIQETPWLRDAQSETEQKKRIALLFDLNKMKNEQKGAIKKLKQMQMSSGGFPWFKGSRYENRYITQHIVAGFGHLDKLGVYKSQKDRAKKQDMLQQAIAYLDKEIITDYNKLKENARKMYANDSDSEQKIADYLKKNHTGHFQIHYLYMRSFFKSNLINPYLQPAFDYYKKQSFEFWKDYNLYSKGMIALVANRNDNSLIANKVLKSLKENSITSDELGMYWKENTSSYHWYQAPIETQALMVEVFSEVDNNIILNEVKNLKEIDNLKIWLLKNKQTNRWKTTKATSEAVYALLLQGSDWISTTEFVDITIGNKTIKPMELKESKVEAGTGYYKTSWNGNEITPAMAEVAITKKDKGIAWGALYWQYFEDLDKITFAETPLKLKKKLFLKINTDRGEKITEITNETKLVLGDLVRVRIELRVDRKMSFIHMKDMRASGFEPINVISRYKWQDGLGYYESTKDASTNFFFDHLPKGVYVFEYDLRVNNIGDFSNGITTIQSMYAPEFSSHSEGVRVRVTE